MLVQLYWHEVRRRTPRHNKSSNLVLLFLALIAEVQLSFKANQPSEKLRKVNKGGNWHVPTFCIPTNNKYLPAYIYEGPLQANLYFLMRASIASSWSQSGNLIKLFKGTYLKIFEDYIKHLFSQYAIPIQELLTNEGNSVVAIISSRFNLTELVCYII